MPIKDDDVQKIGTLNVCQACYQELIAKPEPVKIKISEPKEDNSFVDEPEDIKAQYREMVSCVECKRSIHRVASKEFKDNFYCPDCFYKNKFHESN